MQGQHTATPAPQFRGGRLLFALATLCGIWFGITAPDVSPVAPGVVAPAAGGPAAGSPAPGAGIAP